MCEIIRRASPKQYRCKRCKCVSTQTTNHYGSTWSWGRTNVCPACPPHAKYPEFGGQTLWECLEVDPDDLLDVTNPAAND